MQAQPWSSRRRSSGGGSARHCSRAWGQRGWKAQPDGRFIGLGGSPCIGASGSGMSGSISGIDSISAAVYGWRGDGEHLLGRPFLDDPAEIHHRHPVAEPPHDREIVGDEDHGQLHPVLQVDEEVDDLALDRDVQRGDAFVGDDQLRFDRQRPRDPDALALAAAERLRLAAAKRGVEPDQRQEFVDTSGDLILRHLPVDAQHFGDRLAGGQPRVERVQRVLEHHRGLAAQAGEILALAGADARAVEDDMAGGDGFEPEQRPPERRLARSAFADEPHRLAGAHGERDAVQGLHEAARQAERPAARDREMQDHVVGLNERRRRSHASSVIRAGAASTGLWQAAA